MNVREGVWGYMDRVDRYVWVDSGWWVDEMCEWVWGGYKGIWDMRGCVNG